METLGELTAAREQLISTQEQLEEQLVSTQGQPGSQHEEAAIAEKIEDATISIVSTKTKQLSDGVPLVASLSQCMAPLSFSNFRAWRVASLILCFVQA